MPETRNTKRPNILLIFSDEHEAGVSGFAGDCHVRTQALDGLADNSVRFTSAVCASPLCTPSRMCLLTGKDVHNCAAWNNHWIIFPEHVTWPAHFSNHGYRTCLVGKMHLGGRDQMAGFQVRPYGDLRHGLGHQPEPLEMFPGYGGLDSAGDTEIPESLISDVVATREALAFLREHDDREPDMPWFLCLGYTRPHAPFTAPGRYIRRYRDILPPLDPPSRFRDELEPYARWNYDRYGMENLSAEMSQRTIEAYYAVVDFMDDCIGELLNGLRRDGILENTIVIYSTDHGDMLGAHGLWHKAVYYEQAISVPLLFSGPGIAPGSHIVDHPVSLIDLFPTCCALAGLPVPEGLDGVDMSPVLSDPDHGKPPRSSAASAYYRYGYRVNQPHLQWNIGDPYGAVRIIRERRWKYVDIEGGEPLLFDLENDRGEAINLAEDPGHAGRCRTMRDELFAGLTWEDLHERIRKDRNRIPEFFSGQKPTTPNQYMLPDGRIFDAEGELYGARWLHIPEGTTGGIIPQMFG